jgi:oryzin
MDFTNSCQVAEVEQDQIWTAYATTTQSNAPWGLATLSHRASGANNYSYDAEAGTGTYAYVVDSGINEAHVDLKGRVERGGNLVGGEFKDELGHGTHVSGTIGGTTYGVSKKVNLVGVKIFKASLRTLTSTALSGFNWTVADIIEKKRQDKAVVNLSVGGGKSTAFNTAVENAFKEGIITVAAAGNDGESASRFSPASAPNAVTVGAIDSSWKITSFSNYGDVVDIFAPGNAILSAWIGSSNATRSLSGTSMAAPHITGLVSYIMSLEKPGSAAAVVQRLKALATSGKITRVQNGSPNLIANNGSE